MLLPYEPWHLDTMRAQSGLIGTVHPEVLEALIPAALSYTVVTGEEKTLILGLVGAAPLKGKENTAEVFLVASGARDEHKLVFARSVREILAYCKTRFARIEAACPPDDYRRCRFLEWLGFGPLGVDTSGMMRWSMEGVA